MEQILFHEPIATEVGKILEMAADSFHHLRKEGK
jgi:hypothetical protein